MGKLYTFGCSYTDGFAERYSQTYKDYYDYRGGNFPKNIHLLDNDFLNIENGTRYLIKKYIKSDMKVLELGARYGTVSVCLNYLLNEPTKQLLCVDPDNKIKNCLEKNRNINNCSFNIKNLAQRSIIVTFTEFPICLNIVFSLNR